MKVTITLDYWDARYLHGIAQRSNLSFLERFAVASMQNKLEAAKKRVKAAAEEDEFGGTQFPEEVQHILTDDLEKPFTEVRT